MTPSYEKFLFHKVTKSDTGIVDIRYFVNLTNCYYLNCVQYFGEIYFTAEEISDRRKRTDKYFSKQHYATLKYLF